jgi:predicted type IV restriction endonuclease
MELLDRLRDLAARANRVMASIQTEEACKNAFVMPFLGALGYDVFNPEEVVPEFVADVGTKKGEKVDYAIKKNGKVIILAECKWNGRELKIEHASQLFRYFTVTEARCAVLTNGLIYQFYTDIDEPNKMDSHPFFIFNLLDFDESHIGELKKFSKPAFDIENVLGSAAALKYSTQVKAILAKELAKPSEEFVRLFAARIYEGRMTQAVREQFSGIVQSSFADFIRERVSDRLKTALRSEVTPAADQVSNGESPAETGDSTEIVTTEEELEAFNIIRAIARKDVEVKRIFLRDAKSYCAVLLDDNNRKPIARLHFNGQSKRYVGIFASKVETKTPIESLDDIFGLAEQIQATIKEYM